MNVDKLSLAPQNRINFRRSNYYKVPKESGCYVLTTYDGVILYIGKSNKLRRRFEEHLDCIKKTGATSKGRVFWFYWLLQDELKSRSLEGGWLNDHKARMGERPIMNLIDAPA